MLVGGGPLAANGTALVRRRHARDYNNLTRNGLSLVERGFTEDGKFAKGHKYFPAEHHNPRKRQVTQQLISRLNEYCRNKKFAGKTNLEAIVEVLIARARDGDID